MFDIAIPTPHVSFGLLPAWRRHIARRMEMKTETLEAPINNPEYSTK